jgi:transcriptional regulator with XRE-family HTH domain
MNYKDEDTFNRSFRKLLLELRKNMACSQTVLSKYVGVTRQTISMMESGKRMPSLQRFCELAQGVGLSPAQLMNSLERACEKEFRARSPRSSNSDMAMEYVENAKRRSRLKRIV